MPTIGLDCEIILDGNGYFVKPGSYHVRQPRLRRASYRADGSLSYVDLGPGKRTWSMIILALNDLTRYDGISTGKSGQQYRDALRSSFTGSLGGIILFSDPLSGGAISVHFDSYEERILDLRTQLISLATGGPAGASYEIAIELLEA
ncbi:MAG: hypothetical protein IMW89_12885 [Ktedonobacteraceae bacterium]|nr:hypothetical protein [Ktedonobacteraceae bacterium]